VKANAKYRTHGGNADFSTTANLVQRRAKQTPNYYYIAELAKSP